MGKLIKSLENENNFTRVVCAGDVQGNFPAEKYCIILNTYIHTLYIIFYIRYIYCTLVVLSSYLSVNARVKNLILNLSIDITINIPIYSYMYLLVYQDSLVHELRT